MRHSTPKALITNRGTAFTAELTQAVLHYRHTSHRGTIAYHSQTNGLAERLNKTIAYMLAMYANTEHKTLDLILPYVVFAYNTAVLETIHMTPFRRIHRKEATSMLNAMLPNFIDENSLDFATYLQCAEARQLARLHMKTSSVPMPDATTGEGVKWNTSQATESAFGRPFAATE